MRTATMIPTLCLVATALACANGGETTGETADYAFLQAGFDLERQRTGREEQPIPLKEAKLNIEHNFTDEDTGFQGFVDSEGWDKLEVRDPEGKVVLRFEARGSLRSLGLTELFFETVEPANADVPLEEILATLPEGEYTFVGRAIEDGERAGKTLGKALLTHDIPAGPELLSPAEGATVSADEPLFVDWSEVDLSITGSPVSVISYQLIIEKDEAPHPHMIGKRGLSMYLPPTQTSMTVPEEFLEPATAYQWEVLAVEESGNQTLSSGSFQTE